MLSRTNARLDLALVETDPSAVVAVLLAELLILVAADLSDARVVRGIMLITQINNYSEIRLCFWKFMEKELRERSEQTKQRSRCAWIDSWANVLE
jgi:hypothetical protein